MLKVRRRRPAREAGGVTIIAHGSRCEAELSLQGKMHIDGHYTGRLEVNDHLSIGRQGVVNGVVKAVDITISGIFEGELSCQSLHLLKGARVRGRISYVELEKDPRASLQGELIELDQLADSPSAPQA